MDSKISFKIDKEIEVGEIKTGRKIGTGKSIEYSIGTDIYNNFEVGDSAFFVSDEVSVRGVLVRLKRINKQQETDYSYTTKLEYKNERNCFGDIIKIRGFRIYRVK